MTKRNLGLLIRYDITITFFLDVNFAKHKMFEDMATKMN